MTSSYPRSDSINFVLVFVRPPLGPAQYTGRIRHCLQGINISNKRVASGIFDQLVDWLLPVANAKIQFSSKRCLLAALLRNANAANACSESTALPLSLR